MTVVAYWQDHGSVIALVADETAITQAPRSLSLDELTPLCIDEELIVLIPGEWCTTHTVTVPTKEKKAILQALPNLLEDQLISDIDLLHFAVLGQQGDQYTVGIIEKALLQNIIDTLKQHQLTAAIIIPDYALLPWDPEKITLFSTGDRILSKLTQFGGFALPKQLAATVLEKSLLDKECCVIGDSAFLAYPFRPLVEPQLTWLWQQRSNTLPGMNLLQQDFAPKHRHNWQGARQICRYLAITWLSLGILGVTAQTWYYQHKLNQTEQQINILYHRFFPDATSVTSPRIRIQQGLQNPDRDAFLQHSSILAKAISKIPGLTIQSLQFNQNNLTVTLDATDSDAVENLYQELTEQGIEVTQTLTEKSNGVTAQLILTGAT